MTVVRRELPLSRSASRPAGWSGRRIASARALQSCPHHARVAAPQEVDHAMGSSVLVSVSSVFTLRLRRGRTLRHRRPDEAHQFPCHGHDGDGRPFAMPDQMAIATMQPLLSAPRLAHDVRGLVRRPVA